MRITFIIAALAGVFLFLRTSGLLIAAFVPEDARATLEVISEAISTTDTDPIMEVLDPSIAPEPARASLESIWSDLPKGGPEAVELVFTRQSSEYTFGQGDMQTVIAIYRYRYEPFMVSVSVVLQRHESEAEWSFTNLNVNSVEERAPVHLEFTDMTVPQYVFAAAGGISFMLVLISVTALAFQPRVKRRILWTLFIIGAYPMFGLNWSTGEWGLRAPFTISASDGGFSLSMLPIALFGVGIEPGRMIYPSILLVGLPIGALFFWYRMARGGPTRRPEKPRPAAGKPDAPEAEDAPGEAPSPEAPAPAE